MASALESPLLFSLRSVFPALAQPQLVLLHPLAARQADHGHFALPVVRLALRPHLDRQAAYLEVYERQVVRALFRLAPRRDLHRQAACQVERSPAASFEIFHQRLAYPSKNLLELFV